EILRKFRLTEGKSASTPIDTEKPLLKNPNVCACARFQVTPKASHLHAVKKIFRYLKGKPHLGLWCPKDSLFDLVAYSDIDYVGASLDRKSTTGGCQFLGCRLISWQCKKQTVVATSSTNAEYIVTTSCCAQVLWIQNQLLDYGLQALVDKKKMVITKATIRDALRLDDAEESIACPTKRFLLSWLAWVMRSHQQSLHSIRLSSQASGSRKFKFSKYIFESLVRNIDSSSKFYMYPRFIQLIIKNQLGDLSTHTTKYTSLALTQKVFVNMRRVGKGFSGVETPLFEGILEGVIEEQGDAEEQVQDDVDDAAAQGDDTVVQGDDEALDACGALTRRVEHLEHDKVAQALEITKLKRRVKKLKRGNKVKGRMIDDLDKDDVVDLMDDKGEEKKEEEVKDDQEDEPEVQEVVDVVTTAKLITEVVTAASESVTAASTTLVAAELQVPTATITDALVRVAAASTRRRKGVVIRDPKEESTIITPADTKFKDKGKGIMVEEPKPLKKKQQVEMDEEYARKLHEELNKDIDWDVSIDHVKLDYFKGMSYDDIRLIFKAKFNSNISFLLKSKEELEEEENRAIESINETPAQKAAKRRKLNKEVEDLKGHLEIVPDEDDDIYTEATPLARKVPVVDYEIIHLNNKTHYKIIRADGTHQLWTSLSLEESKDYPWSSIVERRYPLLRFTLDQMLNAVRMRVEEQSEMSLELLRVKDLLTSNPDHDSMAVLQVRIDIADPFSEGPEAVIPTEIGMPTYRTTAVDVVHNDKELRQNLDLLEERRERATIREAKDKSKMTKYYNARVRDVTFRPGDFVYRSNDASHAMDKGKLGPKLE
nr:hypothetical protein [Tanacetum cinerariifolium]